MTLPATLWCSLRAVCLCVQWCAVWRMRTARAGGCMRCGVLCVVCGDCAVLCCALTQHTDVEGMQPGAAQAPVCAILCDMAATAGAVLHALWAAVQLSTDSTVNVLHSAA